MTIKVKSTDKKGRNFACGCQENRYWCANHDIYGVDAKYAPWGRTTTIHKKERNKEEFYNERPDDFNEEDRSCTCHINPPCSKCCPV